MISYDPKNILITGGLGFIGSNLIRKLLMDTEFKIINLDFCGYSSDPNIFKNLFEDKKSYLERYKFFNLDLINLELLKKLFLEIKPNMIFHLAAESHVDRSIDNPLPFLKSNIIGTFNLLEVSRIYFEELSPKRKEEFKFIHISTDEVYGSLEGNKKLFNEKTRYDPRSPYSASKASSDHLVRSWHHTYGLPTVICNCSNNYGPWQFPEKLIPNVILKALNNEIIPIYGSGENIRDWLFVEDHVDALIEISIKGISGESYCIGGNNEKKNIDLAILICDHLDLIKPTKKKYSKLIKFVEDRPGHDKHYGIDSSFLKKNIGWEPKFTFKEGLIITIEWYIKNIKWCQNMLLKSNYKGERLGLRN